MRIGLHKVDITPRVGVELQGYGPFLNRHSDGIRDRLYARALAVEAGGTTGVLVSCDLIGLPRDITATVREALRRERDIALNHVMLHATHTHSGPSLRQYEGWGTPDPVYLEILPDRIVRACLGALDALEEATLAHAEVPCSGIGTNREYDAWAAESVDAALAEGWTPPKPEMTDPTCHVFRIDGKDGMLGFASSYGCHPVLGGSGCRKIHGDWAGVATNQIERLHPGSVGLFLQGAQGDINACLVCSDEADVMRALDTVAGRYGRALMQGLREAEPIEATEFRFASREVPFSRKPWGEEKLRDLLAEQEAILHAPDADDADGNVRIAMVRALALRSMLRQVEAGETLTPPVEVQGMRLGPLAFLGAPFEIFRAIKNDVVDRARAPLPVVLGLCNDSIGYAVDRTAAERGGYAADMVPLICRALPFADIHTELVDALLGLDKELFA